MNRWIDCLTHWRIDKSIDTDGQIKARAYTRVSACVRLCVSLCLRTQIPTCVYGTFPGAKSRPSECIHRRVSPRVTGEGKSGVCLAKWVKGGALLLVICSHIKPSKDDNTTQQLDSVDPKKEKIIIMIIIKKEKKKE